MKPYIWDQYKDDVRLVLTTVLATAGCFAFASDLTGWAAVAIAGAAIAYHTEYRLIIDPKSRTYEWRHLVRPFGKPQVGPLSHVHCVRLSRRQGLTGFVYVAELVFKAPKVGDARTFMVGTGSIQTVFELSQSLGRETCIRIEESDDFAREREFQGLSSGMTIGPVVPRA